MKKIIITTGILFHLLLFTVYLPAQVGIGTTSPDVSSLLDVKSSTKGILIPRMTEFQRSKIAATADGLLVQDLHTGKTLTNRNNYGQWGVIDPVINQNVNFTAFFTATAVHVINYNSGPSHQFSTFPISGPLQGFCSSENVIIFVTQTHVNAIFVDGNNLPQIRSLAHTSGAVVDMGVTEGPNRLAVVLKGNTAYHFNGSTWSATTLPATPANLRVLREFIIFTAGTSAFYYDGNNLLSDPIAGSNPVIYANTGVAIIHTTTNLYSFALDPNGGGLEVLTNTLATPVTNVYDNGLKNHIVVQSADRLRVLQYDPIFGGSQWTSINITGPVEKVVAADKF